MSPARRAAMALVVAASVGGAYLAHSAMSRPDMPGARMLVALIPITVVLVAIARRMRHPLLLLVPVASAATVAWLMRDRIEHHFADLYFLEHAGMMLALAIMFGRTLLPGMEPLCTRFARLVHGSLEERACVYTRRLTATWAAFFALICATSTGLYLADQREAWSLLANIVTPALVVLIFVVEYAVRRHALPRQHQVGILTAVQAFRRHMAGSEAPR